MRSEIFPAIAAPGFATLCRGRQWQGKHTFKNYTGCKVSLLNFVRTVCCTHWQNNKTCQTSKSNLCLLTVVFYSNSKQSRVYR